MLPSLDPFPAHHLYDYSFCYCIKHVLCCVMYVCSHSPTSYISNNGIIPVGELISNSWWSFYNFGYIMNVRNVLICGSSNHLTRNYILILNWRQQQHQTNIWKCKRKSKAFIGTWHDTTRHSSFTSVSNFCQFNFVIEIFVS